MKAIDKRIAARLLALGELSETELERALSEYGGNGSFPQFLVQRGFISPEAACRAEAEVNGFEFVDLRGFQSDPGALAELSAQEALASRVFPLRVDGDTLLLAMGDPSNVLSQDSLRLRLRRPVRMVVAMREELEQQLLVHYGPRPSPGGGFGPTSSSSVRVPVSAVRQALEEAAETPLPPPETTPEAPGGVSLSDAETARFEETSEETLREVEKQRRSRGAYEVASNGSGTEAVPFPETEAGAILLRLFEEAVEARAHEVEIQPGEEGARVRHRVRGLWRDAEGYPGDRHPDVVRTLLTMAGLDPEVTEGARDRQLLLSSKGCGDLLGTLFLESTVDGPRVLVRLAENVPLLGRPFLGVGLPAELSEELNLRLTGRGGGLLLLTSADLRALQLVYHSLLRSLSNRGARDVLSLERRAERRVPGITSVNCPTEAVLLASLANASFMIPDILGIEQVESGTVLNRAVSVGVHGTTVLACLRTPHAAAARAAISAARIDPVNAVRGIIGHLHIHAVQRLCQQCARPIADAQTLPPWARELETTFHEATGCGYCRETGHAGTIYAPEYTIPDLDAADGSFRSVVDNREDLIAASVAGQIDPRHFPAAS